MDANKLDADLNTFYMNFPYKSFNYTDNVLVYKVQFGYSDEVAEEANKLIQLLSLNLIAVSNSRDGIFSDSFLIKEKI